MCAHTILWNGSTLVCQLWLGVQWDCDHVSVCTIDDTVDLFTLGCTLRPASSIIKPWFMIWSTCVVLISSETMTLLFPPLPLLCLPLTPPRLTHLPIALPRACCCKTFAICLNQYEIPIWCEQDAYCSKIWTYWAKAIEKNYKGLVHPKKNWCHYYLLTLMSFQTGKTSVYHQNTN